MKKKIRTCISALSFVAFIALLCLLGGCSKEEPPYSLYYLNLDLTAVVSENYSPDADNDSELIDELIGRISEDPERADVVGLIPSDVRLENHKLSDGILSLYFSETYANMSASREVLTRSAIVRSFCQVDSVVYVKFYVGGETLTDVNGDEVGAMTEDTFVENPGEKINSIQDITLTLYFASADGSALAAEAQHVYYSSNISTEKLIMERLISGPESDNAQSSIPDGTSLISVSVMDGVCFVNLDEGFLNYNYDIDADVVIYSIVNSLTEISTIDRVQISVNGETDISYRDLYSLQEYYTRNTDMILQDGESGTEGEEVIEITQNQEGEEFIDIGE